MRIVTSLKIITWTMLSSVLVAHVNALGPAALQELIKTSAPVTVIDVRSASAFSKAHIPGAINIPAAVCSEKTLPQLGRVIVYDDGLGSPDGEVARAALNSKPGIQAELLEGGFAGWEIVSGRTTEAAGLKVEVLPVITFDRLKKAPVRDLVLVDLRRARGGLESRGAPLSDLGQVFPGIPITTSPSILPKTRQSSGTDRVPPLLVLIDNGDGSAERTARSLRASRSARVVVLAGGEEIIARNGRAGSQRQGFGGALRSGSDSE